MAAIWITAGIFSVFYAPGARAQVECGVCDRFAGAVELGKVDVNALVEASGLAASRRNSGVLWSHNDGGDGRLFAFDLQGQHLATFDLDPKVDDVEDIAVGPGPGEGSYLYIGDIGGSANEGEIRNRVRVHRVLEPFVNLDWSSDPVHETFSDVQSFTLNYPDGSFDAETLMIDPLTGDVIVVTKEQHSARFYKANLNGIGNGGEATLEFLRAVSFEVASGGAISPDGHQIALRNEKSAGFWARCDGETVAAALGGSLYPLPVVGLPDEPNGEAITFLNGAGYLTLSEGKDQSIRFFQSLCPAPPVFLVEPRDQSELEGGQVTFEARVVGSPAPTFQWRHNGQPISGANQATLVLNNVQVNDAGTYELAANNSQGTVSRAATLEVRELPDLRITEVESDQAPHTEGPTADWWELTSFENRPIHLAGWRFNDGSGDFSDAYVFADDFVIAPGESIILVEGLSAAEFRAWWGDALRANLQVITYTGSGLSLAADGDQLHLWTAAGEEVDSVEFGGAEEGVSFGYDPAAESFGALSQLGVNGAFRAATGADVGSPGRLDAPAEEVRLNISVANGGVRIGFDATAGHRYVLYSSEMLDNWTQSGATLIAENTGPLFFERAINRPRQFFKVEALD